MQNNEINVNIDKCLPSGISHTFDTGYAMAYGFEEAIMIKNIQYFITSNANRGLNFYEGRYWTYDRLEDFVKHFPYWSIQTVRRVLNSLVNQKVLIKNQFNNHWSNRTVWYAFEDQEKFIKNIKPPKTPMPLPPNTEIQNKIADLLKSTNDRCLNQQMTDVENGKCIYTSNITTDISSNTPPPPSRGDSANASSVGVKKLKKEISQEAKDLYPLFLKTILDFDPDFAPPKNSVPLLEAIDKMLKEDKRRPGEILRVLEWGINDNVIRGDWNGWSSKILGDKNPADYLRKKFQGISTASKAKKDRKFSPSSNDDQAYETMKKMSEGAL